MDPYPVKHIGNMKVLVEAIGQMMKQQAQFINQLFKVRK